MQESEKSSTEAGSRFEKFYVSASLQNTLPLMLNSSSTQTAASEEAKQSRRKQELLTKSLKASESDFSDFCIIFSRQKIYIPVVFPFRCGTAKHTYVGQPAAGSRIQPEGVLFWCCLLSHASFVENKKHKSASPP